MPLSDYEPIFQQAAHEWNLDPNLLKAVAAQESGGNPKAVSSKNAQGLMQIIPETQKYLGITDPNDPVQSIYGAAKYLSEGLDKEGSPEGALLYYHGGPGWRNAYGKESAGYIPGVTAQYQKLSAASQTATTPHTAMSDDDFLKSTGGTADASHGDDDAAFLARTGAKAPGAPAPAEATPDAGLNEYGITEDTGKPQAPTPAETGVSDTLNAIGQGAKEGFGSAPIGMSPQTDQSLVNAGVFNGPNEYNPLKGIYRGLIGGGAALGDLALRTGGAIVGAYQHGIAQAGEAAGNHPSIPLGLGNFPLLGRDLAGGVEAFPTGDTGGGASVPHAPIGEAKNPLVREVSPATHDALDAPLSASFRDNPGVTTPSMIGETSNNPLATTAPARTETPLAATGAAAAPNSVGASASSSTEASLTPKQVQAYRSTAEGQKLLEPQEVGTHDTNQYVYGSNPNTAEIEQNVNTARELKSLGLQSPEVSQESRLAAQENNDARMQHFQQTAGSDVDVQNARDVLAEQDKSMLSKVWENKTDADVNPVIDLASQIRSTEDGRRPIVRGVLDSVTKELYDDNGKLLTDPQQLYGVRKHIDDLLDEVDSAGKPKYARAQSALLGMKGAIDEAIEPAANGFGDYLKAHATDAKHIDEMTALQGFENKLTDSGNRMTYPKVQNMMRQIVDARQSPGLNKFKSITDDSMSRLWALRDDLRRSASAQELARTPGGSDSAQNFMDIFKGVGKSGADMAAHGLIAAHGGPLGNLVYHGAKNALTSKLSARSAAKQTARGIDLLRPKTPLSNPLASP